MTGVLPPERILLVEGVDDKHVVRHLCERHQDIPEFCIREKIGFPNLKAAIGPEMKVSGRTALGILADANTHPRQRWQEIIEQLRRVGVDPPPQIEPAGAIVQHSPKVGIWLMPDNEEPGQLEDFIEKLIPQGDPVWPRARHYIDEIPVADRKFTPNKVSRAQIHAWLATRAEPRKMGTAIRALDLDANAPVAEGLVGWLRELFG